MPRLNARGQALLGIAGGPASVDGVLIAPVGGSACWLTDDEPIFQNAAGQIVTPSRPIAPRGANLIVAQAGQWLAWERHPEGVFGSLTIPGAYPYAVGPDGELAWTPDQQAGDRVVSDRGLDLRGYYYDFRLYGASQWAARSPTNELLTSFPRPVLAGPVWRPVRVWWGSQNWWVYWTPNVGLVAHPEDRLQGFLIAPPGVNAFTHDAVIADDVLIVAYARRQGEFPDDLVKLPYRLDDARVDLTPTIDVPRVGKRGWLAWFEFVPVPPLAPPGNARLDVATGLLIAEDGRRVAQYAAAEAEGTIEAIDAAVARARLARPGLPVVAYWPRGFHGARVPDCDWLGLEAYCARVETPEAFERRIREVLARVPSTQRIAPIAQCYTSNVGQTTDLAALVPVYARLWRDDPRIVGLLVFSDAGRPTGLMDHPEARPAWTALFAGVLGPPPIEEVPVASTPRITIVSYSPTSGPAPLRVRAVAAQEPDSGPITRYHWLVRPEGSEPWQVAADNSADDPDHTYVLTEGRWELALKAVGPGGYSQTLRRRVVTVTSAPTVPPVDRVTFRQEAGEIAAAFAQKEGRAPSPADLYDYAWRRLQERESHAAILQSLASTPTTPESTTGRLRTVHGTYLAVGEGDRIIAGESATMVEVVPHASGKVGLRMQGKFVAAEGGGGRELFANRDAIGEPPDRSWELFAQGLKDGNGGVTFRAQTGHFISASPDGIVLATQRVASTWETFVREAAAADVAPAILPDGRIFRVRASGAPWRWLGVTAFKLAQRFAQGERPDVFLDTFRPLGYNVLRVFDAVVPDIPWPGGGWEPPDGEVMVQFFDYCRARGFLVEVCLLTRPGDDHVQAARARVAQWTGRCETLLLEATNEPKRNGIDHRPLRDVLAASGLLYSSGLYEDTRDDWYGRYGTAHTDRGKVRAAHDLLEYFNGGGPAHEDDPACRVPWVADEPAKPEEWGYTVQDFRAYGGACALLGAGATFHFGNGRWGDLPTPDDLRCAQALAEGLTAFPADAPNGPYRRIPEEGAEDNSRTYVVGDSMVRIRPPRREAPEGGWTSLDGDGILWRR